MEEKEIIDLSINDRSHIGVQQASLDSMRTPDSMYGAPTQTFSNKMVDKFNNLGGSMASLPLDMISTPFSEQLTQKETNLFREHGGISLDNDYIQLKSGKYIPKYESFVRGWDNNERLANLQNAGALEDGIWSRGWDRAWGTISSTFVGGLAGLPYGVASAINEGSITAFYDNDLTSWLDDVAEKAKYNGNQIYYSQAEQDMSILEGAGTKKFWADKVLGGASFTIGTIGSELLWSTLTGGSSFAGRIAQRGLQKGLQASDDIIKAGSKISSATNKFNKAMKKAVTDADAIASTTVRATQKGINAGKVAEGINTARFILTSSAYEAGFEARHMKDESEKAFVDYYQNNMGRMPNQEEWNKFQDELEDSSRNVAIANMALLSVSNLAMFGKMFNVKVPFASGRSVSEGNALTRRMFGYGVKTAEDGTKTVVKSNFLQKGLRTAWGLGKSGATEGIFEEGGQGIASTWMKNYMESTYDPEAVATTLKESASFISPYLKEAVSDQFGTKEGIEEMFIGSIIGSLFGGFGTISGQRQDRKDLERSVNFDNSSQQMREDFINNIYAKESILAKIGGTARSFASQAEQQEAIEKGMPVRAQLKAQESLISMLDTAYSVGKDGGFIDALVADMQSMDVNKVMNEYGMSKQEAQTFIAENIVAVEKLAKDYSKSRELAETIATQAPNNLDKEKIVRGLTLALTTRGNVAEIVKDASIKLKTLLEQNGSSKRGLIAELGTLKSLISGDANKEFENLTQERLKLEEEHTKLTEELRVAQTGEDVETRTNRVKVINERLIEVDQALSNNNKQGEEMLKSLATPIFGEMGVDFTYNSLIELFKEGSQDIEQIIEKEKINNPSMYFQMRDAFDAINEGAEIFRSFDDVLADFSSKDFSFKPTNLLNKLFKKDSSSNEKVQKVIEDLGNLSLSVSDAPTTGAVNDEVSEREKELESELERREAEEIVSDDVLSEVESENISAPIEEEIEITKEVEEERGKEIVEDVVEDVVEVKNTSEVKEDIFDTPTLSSPLSDFKTLFVPRVIFEKAYENDIVNQTRTGGAQTLETIISRGGYSLEELNKLYPEWRKDSVFGNNRVELKPVSSMTTAEIKQELEEIQKEKVENTPQQNPVQDRQKYYETFVKRLGERFNVNVKWEDGGHPSQPNARGWYDVNTNTAHINKTNFDGSTAIHEIFGHPFLNKIKTEKPGLYANLLKEATSNSEAVKYVDEYYNAYPEAKNDEAILYILDSVVRGELSKVNPNKHLLQSINQLIKELKDFVKDLLGINAIEELPNDMNISDLAQMAFYGKNKLDLAPPTFEGKQESLFENDIDSPVGEVNQKGGDKPKNSPVKHSKNAYERTTIVGDKKYYKGFVQRLSKRFNIKYKFVNSSEAEEGVTGWYDPSTNTAYYVEDRFDGATLVHEIFGHPFLNKIKVEKPELYNNLLREAKENEKIIAFVEDFYGNSSEDIRNDEFILHTLNLFVDEKIASVNPSKSLLIELNKLYRELKLFLKTLFIGRDSFDYFDVNMSIGELADYAVYGGERQSLDLSSNAVYSNKQVSATEGEGEGVSYTPKEPKKRKDKPLTSSVDSIGINSNKKSLDRLEVDNNSLLEKYASKEFPNYIKTTLDVENNIKVLRESLLREGVKMNELGGLNKVANALGLSYGEISEEVLEKGEDGKYFFTNVLGDRKTLLRDKERSLKLLKNIYSKSMYSQDVIEEPSKKVADIISEIKKEKEFLEETKKEFYEKPSIKNILENREVYIKKYFDDVAEYYKDGEGFYITENIYGLGDFDIVSYYDSKGYDVDLSYNGAIEVRFNKGVQFQLSPEQKEARIKELQDELARRKAKLEKVHEKYDNMYLKFVEEGKLTREQAIREMEKYNRTDSTAYRALLEGMEDVVLKEAEVDEILSISELIQQDAQYLKDVFNIDVNNITKPTEEDFSRRLELSGKSSLNKAEKDEYDKLGDKILAFNVARGTMVKEDISLMDLINLKTQLAKAKHMSLNEARTLPIKNVVENDLESLKAQEERLKGQDGVGRQNNITQVTEDVYIQYNQRNSNHQITKDTGISHMSLSDIMERVVNNNPDAIITTPEGEEVYYDFEKYNGLANISLFVTVDGMLTEFHVPRNSSHDKDGSRSGRPVTMVFNEQFGTPEAQLKKLTGIDTYTDSTIRSNYVLAIENDAPILKSKEFEPKGGGIIFDPQASARVQAGDELEVVMTLEDDFNRQLHNITAKEEMINAREKQKATVKNLEAQLENEKKFIKDEFIAEDVENKLKGAKKTKENLDLALRIFGIPKDVQKEYNKAKDSLNKFKEKGKNAKGRADMRADINGGALNAKRFTLITQTGKRERLNDGLAIKGQFYDKVDKIYLTTAQADKVMFDLEVAKREKALKEPNYGEIVFNRIQKGELNVKEAILKKENAKNYLSLSSQGRALLKIEEKIKEATTKLNRLTDSINDTAIIANDSIEFQRNANAWIVLPGTKIAVGRLKASYEKVDASEKSRGLIGVRSLLSSQLSADNIEARVKVKADFVFIGTPIHNYIDGVATPQNVSERDVVGHGYIENGTIVANDNIDFEDVFVKNISKKNVDVQIPFAVFEDKVSGRHVAYPVTLGNKTGAEAHDRVIEILDSSLPKGKKLSEINEVLIDSQIPPIGDISILDNQAGIQAMLDQILEQSIPVSVEEFLNKFPQEEGVVQTTLNFKGKAFATPKHVLDLNNVPEAEAHLASLKLQGINYFKEETTKKAKKEATKDCNNGM